MHTRTIGTMLALSLALAGLLSACGGDDAAPTTQPTTSSPTLDGAVLLEARCTECHNLDRVTSARQTAEWWADTVDRMMVKGTQLSEAEKAVLVAYLAETYGP